jgi:hypothetical protein
MDYVRLLKKENDGKGKEDLDELTDFKCVIRG